MLVIMSSIEVSGAAVVTRSIPSCFPRLPHSFQRHVRADKDSSELDGAQNESMYDIETLTMYDPALVSDIREMLRMDRCTLYGKSFNTKRLIDIIIL